MKYNLGYGRQARVILSDKDAVTEWTLGLRGPCVLDEVTL